MNNGLMNNDTPNLMVVNSLLSEMNLIMREY